MATFNPTTFAATLRRHLPNAYISVVHHTDEEREAAWALLHAQNERWNHALTLGHGILGQQKPKKRENGKYI